MSNLQEIKQDLHNLWNELAGSGLNFDDKMASFAAYVQTKEELAKSKEQ